MSEQAVDQPYSPSSPQQNAEYLTVSKPPQAEHQPKNNTVTSTPKSTTSQKRKLIICIDGTSNQFSNKNTNVIEMYYHIDKNDSQLTYYNSGIGTYAKPSWRSWTYLKQTFYNQIDLAIAWNLEKVIIAAYRWLSDTYRDGDQIFLFGFSRGAYQVRALAAMIKSVGLIHAGNQEQIPFAWELYASHRSEDDEYKKKINGFKKAFSRRGDIDIHFLGAWDTVSSIGLFQRKLLPLTDSCSHITYFRHALALDERRVKFRPEHLKPQKSPNTDDKQEQAQELSQKKYNPPMKEVWFAGTHSDIGGGNRENLDLSSGTVPLSWMMDEAESAGLVLLPRNIKACLTLTKADVVESLNGLWWFLELLPIPQRSHNSDHTSWWPHLGKGRTIRCGQDLHWTVLANHKHSKQAQDSGVYAYQSKALVVVDDDAPWKLDRAIKEMQGPGGAGAMKYLPKWEGDVDLIDTLKYQNQDQWLTKLSVYVTNPGNANRIWTYGGADFLKELVDHKKDKQLAIARTIVRTVIGFRDDMLSKKSQASQQQAAPAGKDTATLATTSNKPSIDNAAAIILRLGDILPKCTRSSLALCSESADRNPNPEPSRLVSFFRWLKSAVVPVPDKSSQKPNMGEHDYFVELATIVMEMISELLEQLASKIVKAIVPIAKHSRGRQKIRESGIVEKCMLWLDIQDNTDNGMTFQVMCAFRAFAGQEDTAECLIDAKMAPCLAKILNRAALKKKVAKETLGTLELLARYHPRAFDGVFDKNTVLCIVTLMKDHWEAIAATNNLLESSNFRVLLTQQPLTETLQVLLDRDDRRFDDQLLSLIVKLLGHDELGDKLINSKVPTSLAQFLKRTTPSDDTLESMFKISKHSKLWSSNPELLQTLTSLGESKEFGGNSKELAIRVAVVTMGHSTATSQEDHTTTLVNLVLDEGTTAYIVQEVVKVIEGLPTKVISTNSGDLIRLVSELMNVACVSRFDGHRMFGYNHEHYDNILVAVFGLVRHLSNAANTRTALLESRAYELVSRLRDSATYATDAQASKLVSDLQDLNDMNREIDKYDPYQQYATEASESASGPEDNEGGASPNPTSEQLQALDEEVPVGDVVQEPTGSVRPPDA
ncbi:unnamed protein product [Rhizoctonia solani]|uniref:T6SS Phospholipase effector Tle1-like catalytic domain-containing protein n=1 Tax=Rhizoctonia solani TaxID=456999 RepID=A0A8H3B6X5_9AGAM|nr:unnamed protein product [Rhizoctonia solani]